MKIAATIAASAAGLALSACALLEPPPPPAPAPPAVTGVCAASPAAFAVGRPWTLELAETARIAANANTVRTIGPNTVVTLDFRTDRLNLRTNAANVVTEVNCS